MMQTVYQVTCKAGSLISFKTLAPTKLALED